MFDQLVQSLLPSLEHFRYLGYWLAFFAAFLETAFIVGLFLPGSVLILVLGALAAGGHFDFGDLLWFAAAGAILGDNLNYWLGQRYGRRWTEGGVWFLKQAHFDRARGFFNRHGARSVFLGRFVPSIKEIVPFVAGTVGMQRRLFMFWNVLGAIGWATLWLGAGYLFAQSLGLAQVWLSRAGLLVAGLLLFSLLILWFKRFIFIHGQQWLHLLISVWRSVRTAIAANPDVVKAVENHPRLMAFVTRRLDREHFYGLPLTLLGLAFGYVLLLFGGVVEDLLTADPIVALDHSVAQVMALLRTPEIVQFFIWITDLGNWRIVILFCVVTAAILALVKRPWLIAGLFTSLGGSLFFTFLGKFAFHRPRPLEAVLAEHSYSFPSGHATIAVAFYGFLAYLLIRSSATWRGRVNWFFTALTLMVLIGLSRIILGVHYLSDVWAGYLVGALWLIIGISLSEWLVVRGRVNFNSTAPPARRHGIMGLMLVAVMGYTSHAALHQPQFYQPQASAVEQISGDLVEFLTTRLPHYTQTPLGQRQQPLSIALISPDEPSLKAAFAQTGWQAPHQIDSSALLALVKKGAGDNQTPLAPAFWNNRINDLSFEQRLPGSPGARSIAVQLWRTPYATADGSVFVGIVKRFDGLRWHILRSLNPDLDAARDELLTSLQTSGAISSQSYPFVSAMTGQTLTGENFFTRGQLMVIALGRNPKGRDEENVYSP